MDKLMWVSPRATGRRRADRAPAPSGKGAVAGGGDRRAPFLTDDTDAFADDRWFPPAVITPDT